MPSPPSPPSQSPTALTRAHYDNPSTDAFYHTIWGGSQISIGIYEPPDLSLANASHHAVERLAARAQPITPSTRVLDMGAGYGGAARYLARTYGCHVTCLNLSAVQNERNRRMNAQAGLGRLIDVVEGDFEDCGGSDEGSYDLVWSQDAFLHSADRSRIMGGIDRVLVPRGGKVVFTDLMEREGADSRVLEEVIKRIPVDHYATPEFYRRGLLERGFRDEGFEELTGHLKRHYDKTVEDLEVYEEGLVKEGREDEIDKAYSEKTKKGLMAGAKAAGSGHMVWGIFCFSR